MDFIQGAIDPGAEEINVTGIASIERISDGQVRVTYFVRRRGEVTVAIHLVWDRIDMMKNWRMCDEARPIITSPDFEIVGPLDRRAAH